MLLAATFCLRTLHRRINLNSAFLLEDLANLRLRFNLRNSKVGTDCFDPIGWFLHSFAFLRPNYHLFFQKFRFDESWLFRG